MFLWKLVGSVFMFGFGEEEEDGGEGRAEVDPNG